MNESALKIALVGNPNTGKSSLFNALTGLRQKVGNFPGITVDKTTGYFKLNSGRTVELTDLPGTYSLYPKSLDEAVPFKIIFDEKHPQHPDLVLYIADASNLKRNLVFLTQLIDLGHPVILVLNMIDQAEKKGIKIDIDCLSKKLGIPVVPVIARKAVGVKSLITKIEEGAEVSENTFSVKNENIENVLNKIEAFSGNVIYGTPYKSILKFQQIASGVNATSAEKELYSKVKNETGFNAGEFQRADLLNRYKAINSILKECTSESAKTRFTKTQERIDFVLTHKVFGYLIFFAILFVVFQAIFSWANYPMELIESSFGYIGNKLKMLVPQGVLNELVTNGILPGLSGVVIFIPQIAFLFFFITIMEDTGYLARVAFLMDRTMRRFGLNGKSVIPLISGTACAVPAIMSARNIENTKARLITILVTPLMSCSARLPVYILLIGIAVPEKNVLGFLSLQGLALMAMYVIGFLGVIGGAVLFSTILKTKVKQYFILEMPVYHLPNWNNIGITVYKKVKTFVTEAGKIIVAISIILWFLASFGPAKSMKQAEVDAKQTISNSTYILGNTPDEKYAHALRAEKLEHSYAGIIGKSIEPAIAPLGFDWKIGIALVTSFAAREVFVGTMATLYGLEGDETDFGKLKENMKRSTDLETGRKIYTTATIVSLLLFYAFALQCMSTIAITYKETASLKWTGVQLLFMTGLAFISSFIAYQLLK